MHSAHLDVHHDVRGVELGLAVRREVEANDVRRDGDRGRDTRTAGKKGLVREASERERADTLMRLSEWADWAERVINWSGGRESGA